MAKKYFRDYNPLTPEQKEQIAAWIVQYNGMKDLSWKIREAFLIKYNLPVSQQLINYYIHRVMKSTRTVMIGEESVMLLAELVSAGDYTSIAEAANAAIRMLAASKEGRFKLLTLDAYMRLANGLPIVSETIKIEPTNKE